MNSIFQGRTGRCPDVFNSARAHVSHGCTACHSRDRMAQAVTLRKGPTRLLRAHARSGMAARAPAARGKESRPLPEPPELLWTPPGTESKGGHAVVGAQRHTSVRRPRVSAGLGRLAGWADVGRGARRACMQCRAVRHGADAIERSWLARCGSVGTCTGWVPGGGEAASGGGWRRGKRARAMGRRTGGLVPPRPSPGFTSTRAQRRARSVAQGRADRWPVTGRRGPRPPRRPGPPGAAPPIARAGCGCPANSRGALRGGTRHRAQRRRWRSGRVPWRGQRGA